jgi:Tol biopolymer transport system component
MRVKQNRLMLGMWLSALALLQGISVAQEPIVREGDAPQLDRPLLAYWNFDEPTRREFLCRSGKGTLEWNPSLNAQADIDIAHIRGVHGGAIDLTGKPRLSVNIGPALTELSQISFSAWVRPIELSGYREIFRQECPCRVLFSFQGDGTILSLGLNIDGYLECDAEIKPAQVVDGQWHHCAGTYDGRFMRVYLDGREAGSLERAGKLQVQNDQVAFIGSSSGDGEFFQGSLDDLRIYREALSAEQIAQLNQQGIQAIARLSAEMEKKISEIYCEKESFADTLAEIRRRTVESGTRLDRDVSPAILARLKSRFESEYQQFVEATGTTPIEYFSSVNNEFHQRHVGRVVDLMFEYCPLTDSQRAKLTPDDKKKWEAAEAVKKRYDELVSQGDAAKFSAEWIKLLLAAAPGVQFRPVVSEPVAPYVKPETPVTKDLSAEEPRAALERDWLHQADQNPNPERILNEIRWTRELAERIAQSSGVDLAAELAQLDGLQQQASLVKAADASLYFQVRELKRRIVFRNPVVDFDRLLMVDMPYPQGSEWQHETRHRLGYMAVPGARLLVLQGLSPSGKLTQLMPQAPLHGSFWRPDVSWDGTKSVFCYKPHNEKSFHLYEISLDGSGLTQLTDGPYDDFDPVYLPDEQHIVFSTTRGHTYVRCMPPTNAFVLARCDRTGKSMYFISRNNEPDYLPSVMNDGRLIFTRWEYTDKPLWRAQKLWTMNPDGTQETTFWGNQSVWPDLLKDARSIPNSQRVMFTGSAHHNWFSGSVGIIDPNEGLNFPEGLRKVTADVEWPECGNGPVDPVESSRYHRSGNYSGYYSPYPLSERDFLVSASRNGKFVLYLMDTDGNRELVYEGVHNIFHAIPVRARVRPPLIPDRVAWPTREQKLTPQQGVIFSANVYEGAPTELNGKASLLRVMNIDPKTYTYWHKRPYISTGPVVSIVQSEGVKRILGTVPIESDGSVSFYAPPGMALHFQLLDDQHRALHTMRSFTGVMPGETRGCLGCHESHSRSPEPYARNAIALTKSPKAITPPPWSDLTVSYDRYVQPVLDQYCGKCHQGDGEAKKDLDLTRRPGFLMFDEPYVTLTGKPTWGAPYQKPEKTPPGWGIAGMLMVEAYATTDPAAYKTTAPMTALSYKSRLIELCSNGKHYDVRVDPVNLQRLMVWVDAMCPYLGEEEVRAMPDPVFQGVDWLSVRPLIRSAPVIARPGPIE